MSEPARAIPERLGRYEIVERLSAGGMGEVFVARFVGPGGFVKPVALKRIHPHLVDNEQFIHMLHDEANVTATIRHPNIVATIDVGSDGGEHFVVLDYVSGDPLSRLMKDLKRKSLSMPPWVVAWIGAQIASALHAAHEAKSLTGEPLDIVHRDVSLGNIMLSDDGHPMLFDFGVAKAKQKIHHTAHGELKGKLSYMAPEAFKGASVDRTVDVFSLGVVLYELLTGVSPFQRQSDIETIMALQSAVVPPPSQVSAGIDPALDPIVLAAMARDRAERYPTAAKVEQALRYWVRASGSPTEAGPVAAWLAATFPERLQARRQLLARVANPQPRPAGAPIPWASTSSISGATPISTSRSLPDLLGGAPAASAPASGPFASPGPQATPPSGSFPGAAFPPSGSFSAPSSGPFASQPGLSPHSSTNLAHITTSAGIAPPSTGPSRLAIAAIALVALAVGGALAFVVATRGSATEDATAANAPASSASAVASSASASATSSASAMSSASASAPASAEPVAAAEPVATVAPTAAAPRKAPAKAPAGAATDPKSKGRGPLVRSYD